MDKDIDEISSDLIADIRNSEYVLVGIGEEMQYDWKLLDQDDRFRELSDKSDDQLTQFVQKYMIDSYQNEMLDRAYDSILKLVSGKDYFIVSTLIDDLIFRYGFDTSRVVTPCGGYRMLQCSGDVCHDLSDIPEGYMESVKNYYKGVADNVPETLICKECGKPLTMNQIGATHYDERGYQDQWKNYMNWLQKTINHSICVLELGEGLRFPTVIRFPFEKVAIYNLKSKFYRVNEKLYQINHDASERSVSVKCNALGFMSRIDYQRNTDER